MIIGTKTALTGTDGFMCDVQPIPVCIFWEDFQDLYFLCKPYIMAINNVTGLYMYVVLSYLSLQLLVGTWSNPSQE